MIIHETSVQDCVFLEPSIYNDNRGLFTEYFKGSILKNFHPIQSNCSISKSLVLRGIHRTPYAKLVTCVKGKIYDVCVDLRKDSSTYGKYFGIELSQDNLKSLYIPKYCGHGFLCIEDSIVIYHQDGEYDPSVDETYCYKNYNINWPINPLFLSSKDSKVCQ